MKKLELKKEIAVNSTQKIAMEELATWLSNDPDPNKTLNKIKRDNARKKKLSKDNPVKLMKEEMTEQEFNDFWLDLADLRKYYAIEYMRKGKKLKKEDLAHTYYLPACVYNQNFKYWKKLIAEKRYLEHPEFIVVSVEDIKDIK